MTVDPLPAVRVARELVPRAPVEYPSSAVRLGPAPLLVEERDATKEAGVADASHPKKRSRPVASGSVTPRAATALGATLVVAGLVAEWAGQRFR